MTNTAPTVFAAPKGVRPRGTPTRRASLFRLSLIALALGLVTGLGAVGFRSLISFIHNLATAGKLSFFFDANEFEPASPWGMGIVLVPIIGGLCVVWLVRTFAPEARGHGIPEVMDSIYFKQGRIRPQVALVKSLASALSIGTGASVGREGPIVQIGASIGSSLAQFLRLPTFQRITLLAAGAGAGIAATFNTPLGAVLFAVELMLPEVSARALLPVVLATGAATWVGRLFFGLQPAFSVPNLAIEELSPVYVENLVAFVILGALCGLCAWLFIRSLTMAEKIFANIPMGDYGRNLIGMGMIGLATYGMMANFGQYFIAGTGYATIQAVLRGALTAAPLLLLLAMAKIWATSVSLGSGASGGVFAPSLFIGCVLGGGFGALAGLVLPDMGVQVPAFAMVGMGALVAGTTGAALTAILMVFEMTRDYNVIVPLIVAVAVATGVRQMLLQETIYTVKLLKRGHRIPSERHSNMFMVHPVRTVMDSPVLLDAKLAAEEAVTLVSGSNRGAVVVDDGRILGVIPDLTSVACLAVSNPADAIGRLVSRRYVLVRENSVLFEVLKRMGRRNTDAAIVVRARRGLPRAGDVLGLVTKRHIADSVLDSMQTYGD